jgi:geranylgeranylglycerol-phosphate geranylgeranyltransferase
MQRLLNLVHLIRLHNVAAAVLSVAVGYSIAAGGGAPWTLLAGVATATAGGNVINDIQDRDIDRINRPWRPFPSGSLSPRSGWVLYAVLIALTALVTVRLPVLQGAWILTWVVLLHLYSAWLKRVYLAGNLLVSLVSASGFILGASAGGAAAAGSIPAGFTFFFVLGREFVKDTDDIEGDRAGGARTVPIVSGEQRALRISAALFALLAVSFPLPWIFGIYRFLYALIMVCTVVPILVISAWFSWRGRSLGRVSGLLKLGMFCGMIAFYFGSGGIGW